MRLFIGINFSEETRAGLVELQNELRVKSKGGNFTLPENLHLTLAFLGDCNDAVGKVLQAVMDAVIFDSFDIHIDHLGHFKRTGGDPTSGAGQALWWAGLAECKSLTNLHSNLTKALTVAGFTLETRKYNPHITLARQVITTEQPRSVPAITETITFIDLIQSTRVNGKLTYTAIYAKS